MKAILGKKIKMTQIFDEKGICFPVSLIMAEPNVVTQVKTEEIDKKNAIQIAMPEEKTVKKPQEGHLAKAKVKSRFIREISDLPEGLSVGDKIDITQFEIGDMVAVTGISKGKGFAGTVKRHNFNTGPKTHGSNNYRQPGSIGAQQPQRVVKGKKMAGHMGHEKVTVKNLKIVHIDKDKNLLMIQGGVPGHNNGYVYIWSK